MWVSELEGLPSDSANMVLKLGEQEESSRYSRWVVRFLRRGVIRC